MATHVGRNFCIAPFTQITYGPFNSASPCPYLGGSTWTDSDKKGIKAIWISSGFEDLRTSFKNNEKNTKCQRCWDEEAAGKQSARKMLLVDSTKKIKGKLLDLVDGDYIHSPRQINLQVSNLCNLRCRTCTSAFSTLYAIEGKYYETKNNLGTTVYSDSPDTITFSEEQINEIFDISVNLQRIEFYGGEPMIDKPTLLLLEKLVESGRSKNITLFYNTNGTTLPNKKHLELWKHFAALEFNVSIDGIGEQFTYMRHPGKWGDLLNTVNYLRTTDFGVPTMVFTICTVSMLNVYYLPELLEEFKRLDLKYFLNIVTIPSWYYIKNLPTPVKAAVKERLMTINTNSQIASIINMLDLEQNIQDWESFKFWTREKDEYRKEQFSKVFPEFYELIKQHDAQI
jgi:MoaA/NifB/PqqE/SkfB family radical SAM enzyme